MWPFVTGALGNEHSRCAISQGGEEGATEFPFHFVPRLFTELLLVLPAMERGGRREERKELKKQGRMRAKRRGRGIWPQQPLSPAQFRDFLQGSSPPHPCHMLVSRMNLGSQRVIPSTVLALTLPEGCCRGSIGPRPGAETALITPGTSLRPRKPPALMGSCLGASKGSKLWSPLQHECPLGQRPATCSC